LRFNREAAELLASGDDGLSLGQYLQDRGYGREMIEHYLIPMGAAIWSADPARMYGFPARYFLRFLHNHGLLSVNDRPTWQVIRGGSRAYVDKLTAPFADRIRLRTPVRSVRRFANHVEILTDGDTERFDAVFIASHSDQALAMLADPSPQEREVLGAIPYQRNEAVLHTDQRLLPRRRLAWASWNYHILRQGQNQAALTYHMNTLQRLEAPVELCVTLNNGGAIDPGRVLKRLTYYHPVYTPAGVAAQQRQGEINGVQRTYYCGAYWRFGFHEDGVVSALDALRHFEENRGHAELHLRRAS
jgi:predicted NAD/FAD-binding protein